jgi:hypothetical protein
MRNTFQGRPAAAASRFALTCSDADGRLVTRLIAAHQLRGPSEFFQRLLHQAIGARLPLLADVDAFPRASDADRLAPAAALAGPGRGTTGGAGPGRSPVVPFPPILGSRQTA